MRVEPMALEARHPYAGRLAALATLHAKGQAIAPPMARALGLAVEVPVGVDTDALGTFTGETPRAGTMLDAAIAKARLGMRALGTGLGLASEGAFGPHPAAPFVAASTELIVLVDDELGLVVHESSRSGRTNHAATRAGAMLDAAVERFVREVGFPSHAVVVRPHVGPGPLRKGIATRGALETALREAAAASTDGLAIVEADMRAHVNPTRMAHIAQLAERFAARLATLCEACGAPGFGPVRAEHGLPCEACGSPTDLVARVVSGCARCPLTRAEGRADALDVAPPLHCPRCNP